VLARRLTTFDAVVVGLGSMLGAGIFAAVGPAAGAAGTWLLAGLVVAAVVAFANATSSAELAALYPESGGTYVYARERLGGYSGFLAGWAFVVGKTASLAAIALTFGTYVYPPLARPLGICAVLAITTVNYRGVQKTARVAMVTVAVVFAALTIAVTATLAGGQSSATHLTAGLPSGVFGVLRSAGFLFFAFAGYARIATMAEEVRDPQRTIPRAIPLALAIALVTYVVVMGSSLLAVGPAVLARAKAPLTAAVQAGRWSAAAPVVRVGAAVASLGVLLSLTAGVSRTALSMARRRELPSPLASVHDRYRTPHRAEATVAIIVCAVVAIADVRQAIGFSSFAVLVYYALANASALTLSDAQLRWPRFLAVVGVAGCVVLALTLPLASVAGGVALLAAGSGVWLTRRAIGR
jgi:APA family basic amino acid/polyamine antiporter